MDKRTAKGLRRLGVWVTPNLGNALDVARGDVPMQRYLVRKLSEAIEREVIDRESQP